MHVCRVSFYKPGFVPDIRALQGGKRKARRLFYSTSIIFYSTVLLIEVPLSRWHRDLNSHANYNQLTMVKSKLTKKECHD